MKNRKKIWRLVIPLTVILLCSIAFLFAPNAPDKVDLLARLQSPSAEYPYQSDYGDSAARHSHEWKGTTQRK